MYRSHQTKWTCLASAAIKWRWYLDADPSFAFDIVHRVHLCKIEVVICSLNSFDVGERFVLYSVFWFIHISEFQTIYMFVMFDMGIAAPLTVCGTVFYTSVFLAGTIMCCFGSACVHLCGWGAPTLRNPYIWNRWMEFFRLKYHIWLGLL